MGRILLWQGLLVGGLPLLLLVPTGLGAASAAFPQSRPIAVPSHSPIGPFDPLVGDPAHGVPRYSVTNAGLTPSGGSWGQGNSTPVWLAYDSADAAFWVATSADTVAIVLASQTYTVSASVPVGSQPFGVAADPTDHEVFVTNTGSNNVSVISDTSQLPLASVGVGASPMGIAYDSADGEVFVANQGSNNVSVISATTLTVVATVSVGHQPLGVAFDPATGRVFVAAEGSDLVQAISPATNSVVGNFTVGAGPLGIAVDNATDNLYVTNSVSGNISVVNASSGANVADIAIGGVDLSISLAGIAYDAKTQQVWVGAGSSYLVVLNTTAEAVAWIYTWDPTGVAYDPVDGMICLTNTANATFECLSSRVGQSALLANFQETGLPSGTHWAVDIGSGSASSPASQISIGVCEGGVPSCSGSLSYTIEPVAGYVPTPSSGNTAFLTTVLNISVLFSSDGTYALRFNETGLPSGTSWSVNVNGTTRGGSGTSITFQEPNGTYLFQLGVVPGWTTTNLTGVVMVLGAAVNLSVIWSQVTYRVIITETGLPPGANWTLWFNGTLYADTAATRSIRVPNGTYEYFGLGTTFDGAVYSPSIPLSSIKVKGSAVDGTVLYLLSGYDVEFNESGLPATVRWSIQVGGHGFDGAGNASFVLPNGTYPFTIAPPPGYTPVPPSGAIDVNGGPAWQPVAFVTNSSLQPPPLVANFTYKFDSGSCSTPETNVVTLYANATGGTPPYSFAWTLLTPFATGAKTNATVTAGLNDTVTLNVTDAHGVTASHSAQIPIVYPSCPPPAPNPAGPSPPDYTLWAIVGVSIGVAAVAAAAIGIRRRRRDIRAE